MTIENYLRCDRCNVSQMIRPPASTRRGYKRNGWSVINTNWYGLKPTKYVSHYCGTCTTEMRVHSKGRDVAAAHWEDGTVDEMVALRTEINKVIKKRRRDA